MTNTKSETAYYSKFLKRWYGKIALIIIKLVIGILNNNQKPHEFKRNLTYPSPKTLHNTPLRWIFGGILWDRWTLVLVFGLGLPL